MKEEGEYLRDTVNMTGRMFYAVQETKTCSWNTIPKDQPKRGAGLQKVTARRGSACINLIVMSSDAERKTLKYTLYGDYVYACGKGGESIFLLICLPRLPRGASPRGGYEIWIKVSGRVTLPGSNSPAAFYNCVLSLNMYRFAPRACSPGFGCPLRHSAASYTPGPIIEPRERLRKTYVLKIARRGTNIS